MGRSEDERHTLWSAGFFTVQLGGQLRTFWRNTQPAPSVYPEERAACFARTPVLPNRLHAVTTQKTTA